MIRAALVHRPIDSAALVAEVSAPSSGAVILFSGVVRDHNEGRGVGGIEYVAYESMAARELDAITREVVARFDVAHLAVEHRLGRLAIGEVSIAIAVSHEHRARAYDASRYVIEEVKRRVPIWKREEYIDGTREWVDPTGSRADVAGAGR